MNRKQASQKQALDAARDLIDDLNVPESEKPLILAMALERYESARTALEPLGITHLTLSAIFAAALEYSESLANPDEK